MDLKETINKVIKENSWNDQKKIKIKCIHCGGSGGYSPLAKRRPCNGCHGRGWIFVTPVYNPWLEAFDKLLAEVSKDAKTG